MKSNNTLIVICLLFIIIFMIYYFINNNYNNIYNNLINKTDTIRVERTDTVYKTDTFKIKELIPKKIVEIQRDTVYDSKGNEIELVTENKLYQDTLICDKDTAELQIFTSGIKSNVDSVSLNLRKSEIIRTNTIEITKYIDKPKRFVDRFHIGIQGGYGYGFNYKGFEPYVGIGVSFDL